MSLLFRRISLLFVPFKGHGNNSSSGSSSSHRNNSATNTIRGENATTIQTNVDGGEQQPDDEQQVDTHTVTTPSNNNKKRKSLSSLATTSRPMKNHRRNSSSPSLSVNNNNNNNTPSDHSFLALQSSPQQSATATLLSKFQSQPDRVKQSIRYVTTSWIQQLHRPPCKTKRSLSDTALFSYRFPHSSQSSSSNKSAFSSSEGTCRRLEFVSNKQDELMNTTTISETRREDGSGAEQLDPTFQVYCSIRCCGGDGSHCSEENTRSISDQLFQLCSQPNDAGLATLKQMIGEFQLVSTQIGEIRDSTGNNTTLMHVAARMNNVDCLQYLLELGMEVNTMDAIESTPLHHACANGSKEAVMFLIMNYANINAKDRYDCFPLLIAMRNNHLEVMKILIAQKADINLKTKMGDTCLHVAAREGWDLPCRLLIENGTSISRMNTQNEHILFAALKHRSITEMICSQIDTFATMCKTAQVKNIYGQTIFHYACERGYLDGLLIVVEQLITKAMVEATPTAVERFLIKHLNEFDLRRGFTPLHHAVVAGHDKIAKYLSLCNEVDVDKKDLKEGNTALHYSIKEGNEGITQILLLHGKAKASVKNGNRESCRRLSLKLGKPLEEAMLDEYAPRKRRLSLHSLIA